MLTAVGHEFRHFNGVGTGQHGNAFSVFVAQNFGAGKKDRIRAGMKSAGISVAVFCAVISTAVCFCKNAYADICKRQ